MSRYQTIVEPVINPASGASLDGTRAVHHECFYSVVDVAADSITVYAGPCILYGVYVNTALSAHALPIQDNSTAIITLVASLAAGNSLQWPSGIRFETSLVVNPNDAATGNVTVLYRPI